MGALRLGALQHAGGQPVEDPTVLDVLGQALALPGLAHLGADAVAQLGAHNVALTSRSAWASAAAMAASTK